MASNPISRIRTAAYLAMKRTSPLKCESVGVEVFAMPWGFGRNLTDDDLRAMWAFIHTLPPASHHVDNSTPPTMCPLCGYSHGLGDSNAK